MSSLLDVFPGMLPPPGESSNFINPYSRGKTYTVVATSIIVVMLLLVTNRLYTKYFVVRKLSSDDWMCLLATIASLGYHINCLYEVKHGKVGIHQWNVPVTYLLSNEFFLTSYLGCILVPPAMVFTKLTVFLMYLQLFRPFRFLRICVYIGATITILFYGAAEISFMVFLTPRKGQSFASVVNTPRLFKSGDLSIPVAAVGLGIDIYLLILPISVVVQLHLPTRRKIRAILIFLTGLAACISSALSVYYRIILYHSADITWNLTVVNILTISEMSIGICCVCIPALSRMIAHHLPVFQTLKSALSSRLASLKSTASKLSPNHGKPHGKFRYQESENPRSQNSSQGRESDNFEWSHPDIPATYDMGSVKRSVRTFIGSGNSTVVDRDGIHLQVSLQQHTQE